MRRTLRLFVYAVAMLVAAVGVAALLKDDPGYEAGRSEVSGKLVGLTEYQENKDKNAETAASSEARETASAKTASGGSEEGGEISAPFDTRPASVATASSSASGAVDSKASAPKTERAPEASSPLIKKEGVSESKDASSPAEKKNAPQATPKAEKAAPEPPAKSSENEAADKRSAEAANKTAAETRASASEATAETTKAAPKYERVVTSAKFSMQGSQIKLILQGNAPMVGHYFTLGDPDRVVLDLAGNWEIEMPRVPSNRLIQSARVGQHDDKTRIVFDMKTMGKVALVPLNRNALELRIQ